MSKYNFNIDSVSIEDNIIEKSMYDSKSLKQTYIDFNYVDLGLSSGVLWGKYNLDVDCNKLNNAKDWYGGYYAWGELKPNKVCYSLKDYKFSKYMGYKTLSDNKLYGSKYKYSKYTSDNDNLCCTNDGIKVLLPEDTVVIQRYGIHYDMPNDLDFTELMKGTKSKFIYNYNNVNGLNGVVLTSLKNKNSIFFPCAGYYFEYTHNDEGNYGAYWSKNRAYIAPSYASYLGFSNRGKDNSLAMNIYESLRYKGYSIRPIYKNDEQI